MIIRNSAKCNGCGDEIESTHRHDFVTCSCGGVSVDGGHAYIRRAYTGLVPFTDTSIERDHFKSIDELVIYLVRVHPQDTCAGPACVIHRPTEHHMLEWPVDWCDGEIQRICPHDVRHTDPDTLNPWDKTCYGCDGCCQPVAA